jgi:hypothetical protein
MSLNPPSITIGQLIDNTLQKIGPQIFTEYNPLSQNCQQSNNLLTPGAWQFIKQDAVAIFNNTPKYTSKVARFGTDLGARFNRYIQGEGFKLKNT